MPDCNRTKFGSDLSSDLDAYSERADIYETSSFISLFFLHIYMCEITKSFYPVERSRKL